MPNQSMAPDQYADVVRLVFIAKKNKMKPFFAVQRYRKKLPLPSNLHLLKETTLPQYVVTHGSDTGLDGASAGLEDTLHTYK